MCEIALTIMEELGEHSDLLLEPGAALELERIDLQTKMARMATELDLLLRALRIKRALQQRNLVPIRRPELDSNGLPVDISIRVCSLPDAVAVLEKDKANPDIPADISHHNSAEHLRVWENDGYDVDAARELRRAT